MLKTTPSMKVSSKIKINMALGLWNGQMVQNTKVFGRMEKQTDLVSYIIKMVIIIKEIFTMIKKVDRALWKKLQALNIQATGMMIYQMEKESINSKMANIMKESLEEEENMDLESMFGRILAIMKEIGFMI